MSPLLEAASSPNKFEPGRVFAFANPSSTLSEAVDGEKPLVYIRLHDDLSEGLA
jgi:hypothetical protein